MKTLDIPKSGKCGNIVWQRNRYCQYSYPAFVPYNPRSAAQVAVRGTFAAVSKRWRTLSQAQRDVWIAVAWTKWSKPRLLQRGRLTGCQLFVNTNVALVRQGEPQVDLPIVGRSKKGQCRKMPPTAIPAIVEEVIVSKRDTGSGEARLRYRSCTGVSPDYHRSNTLAGRFDLRCPPKRLRFHCRSQPPRCRGAPRGNSLTSTRNRGKRVVKKRHLGVASPGPPPCPLATPALGCGWLGRKPSTLRKVPGATPSRPVTGPACIRRRGRSGGVWGRPHCPRASSATGQ